MSTFVRCDGCGADIGHTEQRDGEGLGGLKQRSLDEFVDLGGEHKVGAADTCLYCRAQRDLLGTASA